MYLLRYPSIFLSEILISPYIDLYVYWITFTLICHLILSMYRDISTAHHMEKWSNKHNTWNIIYLSLSVLTWLSCLCFLAGDSCPFSSCTCPLRVSAAPPRSARVLAASPEIVVLRPRFTGPLSLLSPIFTIIPKTTDTSFLSCRFRFTDGSHQRIESNRRAT